jgi:hypothetical protein
MDRHHSSTKAPFDPEAPFDHKMLLEGLRRNFGGVSEDAFGLLAQRFLGGCGFSAEAAAHTLPTLNTLETLRESLSDHMDAGDDPNTAGYRHVLLLDPTDVEASVGMVRRKEKAGIFSS